MVVRGTRVVCSLGLGAALLLAPSVASAAVPAAETSSPSDASAELAAATLTPQESDTLSWQNYSRWGNPSGSFVYPSGTGGYVRLEVDEEGPYLEEYDAQWDIVSFERLDASTYAPESFLRGRTMIWGGFFEGSDALYVVVGASNPNEDDSLPVFRVSKYTKTWEWVNSCEVSACNTTVPFDAGSCDLEEVGRRIYIKTCHEMYASDDGLNHQASMALVFDRETMALVDGEWDVSNANSPYGYVSHSFNQDLAVLDGSVYSLEHGDAYPRAVSIKRFCSSWDWDGQSHANVLEIAGSTGNNTTGVSTGGLESSSARNTLLGVGNSVDQEAFVSAGQNEYGLSRNVWLAVIDADTLSSRIVWLTNYEARDERMASTPQIVKVGEDRFWIAWENFFYDEDSWTYGRTGTFSYVFVDGEGRALSEVFTRDGSLSWCQPICDGDDIVWYVTGRDESDSVSWYDTETAPVFYVVDAVTGELADYETASALDVTGLLGSYLFTGSEICPKPTVFFDGVELVEGVDYTLSYRDNVNAGIGTVVATGIGAYAGYASEATFEIMQRDISIATITVPATGYLGEPVEPKPVVTFEGRTLVEGVDYRIVSYENNDGIGRGAVIIEGIGNFRYEASATFDIVGAAGYLGFPDVWSSDWYVTEGYLDYAIEHEIMSGYADGTFGPADAVSRAQVATVLWRMAGEPEADAKRFPDCDYSATSFYGAAVTWARATGVITGYEDGTFGPADSITREQLATMLCRYAQVVAGQDVSSDGSALAELEGADGISQFAVDAMEWAVDRGILSGDMSLGYARVLPQGTADRSQMAKMAVVFQRDVLG